MQDVRAVPALSPHWEGSGCLRLTGWAVRTCQDLPGAAGMLAASKEDEEISREIFIPSSA